MWLDLKHSAYTWPLIVYIEQDMSKLPYDPPPPPKVMDLAYNTFVESYLTIFYEARNQGHSDLETVYDVPRP